MSRSQPNLKNPATRFMQWRGGEEGGGRVTWYDKETEEEKEVKLPFSFIVLDELNTIAGFSKKDRSGFWSNEVKNMSKEEFVVKTKSGTVAIGKYADISDEIKGKGAKYAKSVYIAFKDETGELVLGNIKFIGAALTAWINFNKKFDVYKCASAISGAKKEKTGTNTYFTPIFDGQEVAEATEKAANELDSQLQAYLNTYFSSRPTEQVDDPEEVEDEPEEEVESETRPSEPEQETISLKDVKF